MFSQKLTRNSMFHSDRTDRFCTLLEVGVHGTIQTELNNEAKEGPKSSWSSSEELNINAKKGVKVLSRKHRIVMHIFDIQVQGYIQVELLKFHKK